MTDRITTLRVVQSGGYAGDIALPPLVDIDRARLDEAGARAFDAASAALSAAAGGLARGEAEIGADLAGYRIELGTTAGARRSFALPDSALDVPAILAPLAGL